MRSHVDTINTRVLVSFKKLHERIYEMHTSLVHMNVKLKSSCTAHAC